MRIYYFINNDTFFVWFSYQFLVVVEDGLIHIVQSPLKNEFSKFIGFTHSCVLLNTCTHLA